MGHLPGSGFDRFAFREMEKRLSRVIDVITPIQFAGSKKIVPDIEQTLLSTQIAADLEAFRGFAKNHRLLRKSWTLIDAVSGNAKKSFLDFFGVHRVNYSISSPIVGSRFTSHTSPFDGVVDVPADGVIENLLPIENGPLGQLPARLI